MRILMHAHKDVCDYRVCSVCCVCVEGFIEINEKDKRNIKLTSGTTHFFVALQYENRMELEKEIERKLN